MKNSTTLIQQPFTRDRIKGPSWDPERSEFVMMNLGGIRELRQALGGKISMSYCMAVKRAAGINTRKFDIARAVQWLQEHPDFKTSDAYPSRLRRTQ